MSLCLVPPPYRLPACFECVSAVLLSESPPLPAEYGNHPRFNPSAQGIYTRPIWSLSAGKAPKQGHAFPRAAFSYPQGTEIRRRKFLLRGQFPVRLHRLQRLPRGRDASPILCERHVPPFDWQAAPKSSAGGFRRKSPYPSSSSVSPSFTPYSWARYFFYAAIQKNKGAVFSVPPSPFLYSTLTYSNVSFRDFQI